MVQKTYIKNLRASFASITLGVICARSVERTLYASMDTKAIDIFRSLEVGILNLVRAADLLTIHLVSRHRGIKVDRDLVRTVLGSPMVSGFTMSGDAYKPDEISMLEQTGHLRQIGEQIVLATYTSLEIYLIQKFTEYYAYKMLDKPPGFVQNTLKRFSFRGLDEIKRHYSEVLDVYLTFFDIEYYSDDKSHFQPVDSWAAIKLIESARHEIAHQGVSTSYKIVTPLDSWYPFEFTRRWVASFDANFDLFFYKGQRTSLYEEYERRLQQST